ncbi:hypothetical protein Angca_003757, partial [Angiostrongylus cantonensis]
HNTQLHLALVTLQKLNELGYEILYHPLHSKDFPLTDYQLFKHLDNFPCDKCFRNQSDIETAFNHFTASNSPKFCAPSIIKLLSHCEK